MNTLGAVKSGVLMACCVAMSFQGNQAMAAERVVLKDNNTFSQLFIKVDSNDVVSFVNDDSVAHVLTFKGTKTALSVKKIPAGASQSIKFSTPGVYDVICQDHPDMKLTMVVSYVDRVVSN